MPERYVLHQERKFLFDMRAKGTNDDNSENDDANNGYNGDGNDCDYNNDNHC